MVDVGLEPVEQRLLHALQVDGRVSFSRLAKIIGVSDQTVARRYRKLQADLSMRVVARLNARLLGWSEWFVRVESNPDASERIAAVLARHEDTSWVSLMAGGTEVVCLVRSPEGGFGRQPLLRKLASASMVSSISAQTILHTFVGGPVHWPGMVGGLTEEESSRLVAELPGPVETEPIELADGDRAMIAVLAEDGRAPVQQLCSVTGWAENTVRKRLEYLRASGVLFFDLDIDYRTLGFRAPALLWISVRPQQIMEVATAAAQLGEISFVAATTGRTNLLASVFCRDDACLFECLTGPIGSMDGVRTIDTSPITAIVKRAITLTPPDRVH